MKRSGFALIDLRLRGNDNKVQGFTLIELLVVIAILAVLAVVVVLTLNPAGLLQESRDANRLQDMATVSNAIGYSLADNSTESLGAASTTYISIPDPSATSTAGDQCQGLGLPALPSGWTYQCASAANYRNTNGTGWIPINLSQLSFGTPLAELPIDPLNTSSSGFYYTYTPAGSQFEVTSIFESQKYKLQFGTNPMVTDYPEVDAKGTNLSLSPLYSQTGLLGYWNFDEGTGSTTFDQSGGGNNGAWSGTPAGTSGYYSGGKVGAWAGVFSSGGTSKVSLASPLSLAGTASKTIELWFNPSALRGSEQDLGEFGADTLGGTFGLDLTNATNTVTGHLGGSDDFGGSVSPALGSWSEAALTYNGSLASLYFNGQLVATNSVTINTGSSTFYFGQHIASPSNYFVGSIDDARLYSRALSAAEIQALYNAEK